LLFNFPANAVPARGNPTECGPKKSSPQDFGWDPSKDDPGKLHGGPSQVERMRAVAREPWPANKISSLPDAPVVELLNDILSTTPLQSASLMADPKLKMQ
jgi:hypothetical protein